MLSRISRELPSMIAAIWIGLILGVSFYAAPIKFTTSVGLEQLLEVGKVTFQVFSWIELAVLALLIVASLKSFTRKNIIGIATLLILLLIQKFGILPGLDSNLDQAVAGEATENASLHYIYVALECLKLPVLFFLALNLRPEN